MNTYRAINSNSATGGGGARVPAVGGGGRAKPASSKKSKKAAVADVVVDAMDDDGAGPPNEGEAGRTTEAEVKELIEGVLKMESLEGRRAASMDIDDLLGLLSAFNEKGVHFA